MNILISGAGIAGTTLAFWLKKNGFNPTIIEIAPRLREGGYVIDFFGAGVEVAQKMDIIPEIKKHNIEIAEIVFVNEKNERQGALSFLQIRKVLQDKVYSLLRSNLALIIYEKIKNNVEILFNTSIQKISEKPQGVEVGFKDGTTRTFDLVIGADGLHSSVRRLILGDESKFEKYYGYYAASFTLENYLGKNNVFLSHTVPGKQASLYSLKNNKLAAFFIFRSLEKLSYDRHDSEEQKTILRDVFSDMQWECPEIFKRIDEAKDFYFDPVSQIRMEKWSHGRVSLVGDACDCPSLLSGQGSTLAMVGAYILAGELKEAQGNYEVAFKKYEAIFKPFIAYKQNMATKLANSFVPKSRFGVWTRNFVTSFMSSELITRWFIDRFMKDDLKLKEY